MKVHFSESALNDIEELKKLYDKDILAKITTLIVDIIQNGVLTGAGKPERLKYFSSPRKYSRRINHSDRLVYYIEGDILRILSCKGHYE